VNMVINLHKRQEIFEWMCDYWLLNPFTELIDFKFFFQNVSNIYKNHKVNILTLLRIF
jgi:hypothetical protein